MAPQMSGRAPEARADFISSTGFVNFSQFILFFICSLFLFLSYSYFHFCFYFQSDVIFFEVHVVTQFNAVHLIHVKMKYT